MRRGEETKRDVTVEKGLLVNRAVSVGEFRGFVARTGYLTDCEKLGGGWVIAARRQWIRKPDASWDNPYMPQEEHDPVGLVSWYDAVTFANWKSAREGLSLAYTIAQAKDRRMIEWDRNADGYRLPTEAEWDRAVRAGLVDVCCSAGARRQKAWRAMEPDLPSSPWCEVGFYGHKVEWCWDSCGSCRPEVWSDLSKRAVMALRARRGAVPGDGDAGEILGCRGNCDPLTAASILGFRLVRGDG